MVNKNTDAEDKIKNNKDSTSIQLGLKPNIKQFVLLIIVNAFVGAMIGLEQTVIPILGQDTFDLESNALILSFIASFGLVKAVLNLFAGSISDKFGRKNVLILGWLFGLPIHFILLFAPDWNWILFANVLLGINQGLAWSMTVNMKIDLVGTKQRGLALGLNEFAGYVSGFSGSSYWLHCCNLWTKTISILPWNCISYIRTSNFFVFSQRHKKIYSIRNKKSKRREKRQKIKIS